MYFRNSLLASSFFATCLALFLVANVVAQNTESDTEVATTWISHPQPGVTLIGQPNSWSGQDLGYRSAVSPDGEFLIGVKTNKDLVIFRRESMEVIREIPINIQSVMSLQFSSDGSRLAIVGHNVELEKDEQGNNKSQTYTSRCILLDDDFRVLHEMDFEPKKLITDQASTLDILTNVCFSPDSRQAIITGQVNSYWIDVDSGRILQTQPNTFDPMVSFVSDDSVYLWRSGKSWNLTDDEVASTNQVGKFTKPTSAGYFMPHRSQPLIAFYDQTKSEFAVANWETGKTKHSMTVKDYVVYSGQFSDSGNLFTAFCYASDFKTSAIVVFDLKKEKIIHSKKIKSNQPIETQFINEETIVVLQPNRGVSELKLDDEFEANADRVLKFLPKSLTLETNHDGSNLLVDFARASVDLNTGDFESISSRYAPCFTFSNRGDLAVLGLYQGKIELIDLETNETKKQLRLPAKIGVVDGIMNLLGKQKDPVIVLQTIPMEIRISENDKSVSAVFVEQQDQAYLLGLSSWDIKTGRQSSTTRLPKDLRVGKNSNRMVVRIFPSCQRLAYATSTQVMVVDAETLEPEFEFDIKDAELLEVSNDEAFLAVGYESKGFRRVDHVKIFDLKTGEVVKEFDKPNQTFSFAAHADKFAIVSGLSGHQVRIYDTEDWENETSFETEYATRTAIGFSGDGKRLVSCLADTRIEVWDLEEIERDAK